MPIGLTADKRLTSAVAKDQQIRNADVILPAGRLVDDLRAQQAAYFGQYP